MQSRSKVRNRPKENAQAGRDNQIFTFVKLFFERYIFDEYDTDFFDYLSKTSTACHSETRYKELMEKIKTLYKQYPNVRKVLDVDSPCELSAEECTALSKVLKCKNEIANLELKEVYFKGCIDCVSYLKKLSIL